jgi:hypothetical protein
MTTIAWIRDRALTLALMAFVFLFVMAWVGHALGGLAEYAADQRMHGQPPPSLTDDLMSAILVRIIPELAERVSGDCLYGRTRSVPASAMVAGIETGACAACRNGTLKGHHGDRKH